MRRDSWTVGGIGSFFVVAVAALITVVPAVAADSRHHGGTTTTTVPTTTTVASTTTVPSTTTTVPSTTTTVPSTTTTVPATTTTTSPAAPLSVTGANCTSDGGTTVGGVCRLPDLQQGQNVELLIQSSGGSGPTPFLFKVVAGSIPPGMTLPPDAAIGSHATVLAGTPSVQGTFTFTVQVTDGVGNTATGPFSVTVGPPATLQITTPGCANGTVGVSFHLNFFAQGGVLPYTWSRVSGQFPPGLSLSSPNTPNDFNNVLSGTPTTAGTFTYTMQVTDGQGATATGQPCTMTISR